MQKYEPMTAVGSRVIEVIETNSTIRGTGKDGDPYRHVVQYLTTDGRFLAEVDPVLQQRLQGLREVPPPEEIVSKTEDETAHPVRRRARG